MSRVEFKKAKIYIDGIQTQLISGAIHYWRVPEALWDDRLEKAAAMGLNCVESYIPWNRIEPEEGKILQDKLDEIVRFAQAAAKAGLYVILRPGPYICAEYDNGGFPYWLMTKKGIHFRRVNAQYQTAVERFFNALIPALRPLQIDCGGPLLMLQVENEYGSYSHDADYVNWLKNVMLKNGITVPLFTADGGEPFFVDHGNVASLPEFLTGGSRLAKSFDMLHEKRPDDPLFFIEFWCGWFNAWGTPEPQNRPDDVIAGELDDALAKGGSINIYMFHGGSQFGYTAGANIYSGKFSPDTSSYDYQAPLDEQGNPTSLFYAFQKVIAKYRPDFTPAMVPVKEATVYPDAKITSIASFWNNLDAVGTRHLQVSPETMETMGQANGFVLYRTRLSVPMANTTLDFYGIHDRAQVFMDGKLISTLYRNDEKSYRHGYEMPCLTIPNVTIPQGGANLDILVESFGHVNYGGDTGRDFKGLTGDVCVNTQNIHINWETWSLPLAAQPDSILWTDYSGETTGPAFYKAEFSVESPEDTFLKFPGTCGQLWINGFLLGRYWNIGPEKAFYLPAPLLKKGKNTIVFFETEQISAESISFCKGLK